MKPLAPDLPNFKAWSLENLAAFCTDAYIRMQEQAEELQQVKLEVKVMNEYFKTRSGLRNE